MHSFWNNQPNLSEQQQFTLLLCAVQFTVPLSSVQFSVPAFLGFTFHTKLELQGHKIADLLLMNPKGLREWTGGPFIEPCVLLQTAGTVQTVTTLIGIFWSYVSVYVFLYNYVQPARSFKWKSCSYARSLRDNFSVSILRSRKLLNTEILQQKI